MYIIRYGEIFLKSEAVRRRWEDILIKNIKKAVGGCDIRRERGRIWIESNDVSEEALKRVFGIVSFSKCEHCKLSELNEFVIEFGKEVLRDARTFAIRVKRVGSHDFTSQEKASELGYLILKAFPHLKVDLEHPDKEIFVEIRDEDCYVFDNITQGAGGIPIGVEGKLVSLFSGGIDSPVATYLMMKRGCEIIPVYFDISPFADENTFKRAVR
ncbi:MAG: tRNA sulfurtransferase, partial [Candidatus Methanospirareceae archaeon]